MILLLLLVAPVILLVAITLLGIVEDKHQVAVMQYTTMVISYLTITPLLIRLMLLIFLLLWQDLFEGHLN